MKNISLNQKTYTFLKEHELISPSATIIVGLSGGPDSVSLLHVLNQLKVDYNLKLIAAHMDHGWRAESSNDAQFCHDLCDRMGVQLVTQKLSNLSAGVKFNGSREEYARKVRRQFFEGLAKEHGADAVALGHHEDDQKETFFIRIVRGASLTGLTGMQPKSRSNNGVAYIRPLLSCSKKDIIAYLARNSTAYLTDPSNISDDYLRNRIRNHLLPKFDKVDDRAQQNLMATISRLQSTEAFLVEHTSTVWGAIACKKGNSWHVDCIQLLAQHEAMRQRLLMHWLTAERVTFVPTQRFFAEIERFLRGPDSKTHQIHRTWTLNKRKNRANITKR